ncbi:biosynthetic-type acetolactate synthase large subunit [Candidatus Portiera aleyrodidarum]|uniref:Acetolactate synthase n=1 Tax=Candidatus Portiera aleyrodidarum TaxID=91844 RepID=A0A8D9JS74_9GAMM|nr:biosynthetic-type acetolactate synthase large subunit [Candidatus Portiera aleyrodidarum]CEI58658.1 Acetolactate synthase isozyme 3 large subunit [Candidatus Portiera aleyrodidarum]
MELLSGADMIIRFMKDEGVKYIYGYPGGAALHIYDALFRQDEVKHILVRHEQAATHMADGYARASGKPGVVLVTSGPGATNAVTGIATAYMDSIPMVILCGQVVSKLIGEDAFQETDIVGVTRPIVKHSFTIRDTADIPLILKKAFYIASSGRLGPVLVDIPKDMTSPHDLYEYIYPKKLNIRSFNKENNIKKNIKKALKLLYKAERPVLFAGGGAITGEASKLIIKVAKLLFIPVITSLMGIGAFPQSDFQCLGWAGMHGSFEANNAMHNSDIIFCIGARFDDRVTNNTEKFCPNAKVIHIDIDPCSISKTILADVPIVGSAKKVLTVMLKKIKKNYNKNKIEIRKKKLENWWKCINEWISNRDGNLYKTTTKRDLIKPQQVIEAVYKLTKGEAYIATDVGQHQMFTAQYYKFNKPNRFITSGGLGTMGFGLPAAMGIKLSFPKEQVVLFTGEGSFQMMMQELSTCKQFDISLKIIHLNNGTLGMVRQWQDINYKSRHANSYVESLPEFHSLFEAYGFKAISVKLIEELEPALEKVFLNKNELVFINIYIDPHEHVYPMQRPLGAINDMLLSKLE